MGSTNTVDDASDFVNPLTNKLLYVCPALMSVDINGEIETKGTIMKQPYYL